MKRETRGRPRNLETVDAVRRAVIDYHAQCEETETFPDLAGLRLFMKVTKGELKAMATGDSDYAVGVRRVLEEAQDMRESWLARKMTSDNKRAIGCMNALKQLDNGGYVDRPAESGEKTLTINVSKIKGGEKAFK